MSREIMQQALSAFEEIMFTKNVGSSHIIAKNARYALREELAKPEQKPVTNSDLYSTAGRLALELECLLLDTKDISIASKWWDSAHEALDQWRKFHLRFCNTLDSAETFSKPDIGIADPCPQCQRGGVCRTMTCRRLQLPVDHPYRNQAFALAQPEHPLDKKADNARELGLDYDHGFDRTASHMAGEYVSINQQNIDTSLERVHKSDKSIHEMQRLGQQLDQQPVAWLYDFYSENELIKDWTTTNYDEVHDASIYAINVRPLYLLPE